jgi:hypothetical protein
MVKQITVYIASYYRKSREDVLGDVLAVMLDWKDVLLDVTVMSNVPSYLEAENFRETIARFEQVGFRLKLEVVGELKNPRLMTWAHKKYVPEWAKSASPGEDFFIYIEDDILITDANLQYYLNTLDELKPKGMIPGFLRYEKAGTGEIRLVDQIWPEYWERDRTRKIGGKIYHACINPYWAGYFLDRDLAEEYVASDSFDLVRSERVHHWHVQERAAMGLTFEKPPRDLRTRVVIPLLEGMPHPDCLVWHRTNNYTDDPNTPHAKKTPAQIFQSETYLEYLARRVARRVRTYLSHPA